MDSISDSLIIRSNEDIFLMLDDLLKKPDADWWDAFYADKTKPVPFFRCIPDENLHSYIEQNIFTRGRILDIGCGMGRNAIYLAKCGFIVDAIDFSSTSINWAEQNAKEHHVKVNFIRNSIFDYQAPTLYDYIYDSGCFHHIKPHRRIQYIAIISDLLKSDGYFGMTCFNQTGGADISDYDVYKDRSMHGGMGYSEQKIRKILQDHFEIVELRNMQNLKDSDLFGMDMLWAILMRKK
ncbi:class I SAM-dependent methyltransferase [Methanospirillum lacunae]|uniref:SAM-dependent methyltransferase n=1 Tax=Methanospirillum lacunae TaxID=668570 RepID=A0A2V2N508_9EURY|nr:class I SAM-dependent methyltransferase [Methanospirillum lacunae]PWR71287.1 SAM-dependent methyltransferase [Methanospirillum lacunae]